MTAKDMENQGRERLEKLEPEYEQVRQEYLGKLRNVQDQIREKQAAFQRERQALLKDG